MFDPNNESESPYSDPSLHIRTSARIRGEYIEGVGGVNAADIPPLATFVAPTPPSVQPCGSKTNGNV